MMDSKFFHNNLINENAHLKRLLEDRYAQMHHDFICSFFSGFVSKEFIRENPKSGDLELNYLFVKLAMNVANHYIDLVKEKECLDN